MKKYVFVPICSVMIFAVIGVIDAHGEIDSLSTMEFLQTGTIFTEENKFSISNDLTIREFSNSKIVRISGQTIEGFPYITYSRILEDSIDTRGKIFIQGEFVELKFDDTQISQIREEKSDDIDILVQYSQRVFANKFAQIDVKLYDEGVNKLNDFYQNYGYVTDADIKIDVLNENNEMFYSVNGTTNERGFFETEFFIPVNSPSETLTVTISAENEDSESSKIFQIFSLGRAYDDGSASP